MARSDRSKRYEAPQAAQGADRPKIWIDGHQRPRFGLRAFAATSFGMAKRGLAPAMHDAEGRLRAFGERVRDDDQGPDQARAGGWQRVGAWALGLSRLFAGASARLTPPGIVVAAMAYPAVMRGSARITPIRSQPAVASPAQGPKPAEEPTLRAIRSAIRAAPQDAIDQRFGGPVLPIMTAATPVAAATWDSRFVSGARHMAWGAGAWALLGVLMAFALPAGAIRALLFHLDGGDLADWS